MAGAVPIRSCSGLDLGRMHTYQTSKWGMWCQRGTVGCIQTPLGQATGSDSKTCCLATVDYHYCIVGYLFAESTQIHV